MGAFTAGLAAAQGVGMALRVSCATPVVGPVGGLLGVGLASAAAGQASIATRQYLADRKVPGVQAPPFRGVRSEDLVVDALLGIAFFKVMGGRFRSVMPSDVAKVGAIARESMPAAGVEYATEKYRIELRRLFRRDGCHHCGTRRGAVIGDHMPPNKYVKEYVKTAERAFFKLPFVKQAAEALAIPTGPPKQRYYPQCTSCCEKQSAAVRNDKLKLVFHEVLHHGGRSQAWHYAGTLLGLRHYSGGSAGGGSAGYGANGRRR
ncbi:pfkB family carbohydrate kinase [Micractinium conductrix]|uniref:PfkB family carbohydrate kinase n=1 Tax=Micractinium conductrix TaxID=554055 RepID=A0A2P6V005_9CHLO|nr:pfkB family carbohydrate kinase [Micractinium conductrix]|eukprot:PSC67403.1 pfkB family carbohydrate kinase [Micractinium conductrix]